MSAPSAQINVQSASSTPAIVQSGQISTEWYRESDLTRTQIKRLARLRRVHYKRLLKNLAYLEKRYRDGGIDIYFRVSRRVLEELFADDSVLVLYRGDEAGGEPEAITDFKWFRDLLKKFDEALQRRDIHHAERLLAHMKDDVTRIKDEINQVIDDLSKGWHVYKFRHSLAQLAAFGDDGLPQYELGVPVLPQHQAKLDEMRDWLRRLPENENLDAQALEKELETAVSGKPEDVFVDVDSPPTSANTTTTTTETSA